MDSAGGLSLKKKNEEISSVSKTLDHNYNYHLLQTTHGLCCYKQAGQGSKGEIRSEMVVFLFSRLDVRC